LPSTEPHLSNRERRFLSRLKMNRGSWKSSLWLTTREFGPPTQWPRNARVMSVGVLRSLGQKFEAQGAGLMIAKRGGGRGGTDYKVEKRR